MQMQRNKLGTISQSIPEFAYTVDVSSDKDPETMSTGPEGMVFGPLSQINAIDEDELRQLSSSNTKN